MAERAAGDARGDGSDRGVLETDLLHAGERLRTTVGQPRPLQASARTQDRRRRLRVAGTVARARIVAQQLCTPAPIRELRDLTRYRKSLTEERTRAANRLHKVLQDAGIKLSSVATDMLGVSGRSMLMALVAGTTDPALLGDLACGQLRKKLPELHQALT